MVFTQGKESAGGVVRRPDGKIALVCQHNNSWSLPKGGVEEGESALEAARREIWEETGIQDIVLIKELGSYERLSIGKDGIGETEEYGVRKRIFFLFSTSADVSLPHDPDGEITQARFVTVEEALALMTHPKDKEFLASIRDAIGV